MKGYNMVKYAITGKYNHIRPNKTEIITDGLLDCLDSANINYCDYDIEALEKELEQYGRIEISDYYIEKGA